MDVSGHIPPVKESEYALNRMLGGPQSRSGPSGEEKNVSSLPVFEPDLPASSIVTILITLCRILFLMAAQRHRMWNVGLNILPNPVRC